MSGRAQPVRICVGCGERAPQGALVRFVAAGTGLELDAGRRLPGRGAYLHPRADCFAAFVRHRGPVRSLRATPARSERERLVAMVSAAPPGVER